MLHRPAKLSWAGGIPWAGGSFRSASSTMRLMIVSTWKAFSSLVRKPSKENNRVWQLNIIISNHGTIVSAKYFFHTLERRHHPRKHQSPQAPVQCNRDNNHISRSMLHEFGQLSYLRQPQRQFISAQILLLRYNMLPSREQKRFVDYYTRLIVQKYFDPLSQFKQSMRYTHTSVPSFPLPRNYPTSLHPRLSF